MKAVILAGGKGTRLGSITQNIPKPMVRLAGKPIMQYQVELCARYGLDEIIVIVNHLGDIIEEHFGKGERFGIPISYFHETKPLGTVGGIKEIEDKLNDDFLVLYGDVMMEMDLDRLIDFHKAKRSQATLVAHPNDHPYDSDLLEMDEDDRVVKVLPKPHAPAMRYHNMVNAAVYLFSPDVLRHLQKGVKADFGKDIFPSLYEQIRMYGYNTPEYLKDMGTPDRMEQVERDIQSGKVFRRSLARKQHAIFLDRDGVLNEDINLIHRPEDLILYPYTSNAIKKINQSEFLAIVATNQSVVARNLTDIKGLGDIHKKMETELGNDGAKLDLIKYCPHHPDKGYPEENVEFKIDCHCRKPKPGMLMDAADQFHIDLSRSWMIGDSERDVLAGKAAGCQTIGVMTGQGLRRSLTPPDYLFPTLMEAVDYIIEEPYKPFADKLLGEIKVNGKGPYVIAIGGNSRSGKSTFHTYLRNRMLNLGHRVSSISLDDWIRPKAERIEKDEVFHNFQIEDLERDIRELMNGQKVSLQAYVSHPQQKPVSRLYEIQDEEVIIIEGVVALATEQLRELSDYKVFLKISEEELKRRFGVLYNWKGLTPDEIEELWLHRLENEYRIIAKNEAFADLLIG